MDNIYADNILDHAYNPRNARILDKYNCSATADNAVCGDNAVMQLNVEGGIVVDIGCVARGCALSTAGCSILSEYIKGKSIDEIKSILPGTVYDILGISVQPTRVNCIMLGYNALVIAIANYATIENNVKS